MNISIIGFGGMGQLLAGHLAKKHEVKVYDKREMELPKHLKKLNIKKAEKLEHALSDADVLFVCIRGTSLGKFLVELEKHVGSHQLLVDISSVKSPTARLFKKMPCRVASVHPLFGPDTESLEGKDVVVISDIGTQKDRELAESFFHPAKITRMTVKAHDSLMAELQVLPVLLNLAFAETLSGKPPFYPPNFATQWKSLEKVFSDDPSLLSELVEENPFSRILAKKLSESTKRILSKKTNDLRVRIEKSSKHLSVKTTG